MSRRARLAVGATAVLCAAALGSGLAYAAFVATAANGGNSFQAASCFSTQRMASGSYTGDAADNRSIAVGFQPDFAIVKADTAQIAVARSATMGANASKLMTGATALVTDGIKAFGASAFTIGTNSQVNQAGTTYRWIAFKASCGTLKVGSYTGNGTSQSISGAGFQPEYVLLMSAGTGRPMQRFAGMTTSFRMDASTGVASVVNSLDADGFSVGNAVEANASGTVYHYVAFNEVAGSVKKGSYVGNAVDDTSIGGVGFQPDYVMVRANDTATARTGQHRPAAVPGTSSLFWENTANNSNAIQALQADGFQVGTNASVNAAGPTYHYLAFKNAAGGCSLPGSQTIVASEDSWLDQGAPTTNYGNATVLKVASRATNLNARAVVKFNLPTLPAGCSVTGATLRLYDASPGSGRTLGVLRNSATWTEAAVTWSNQPATTGTAVTATSPAAAGWMQWAVTSQVQAMYSGSNYGFSVRDQTENGPGVEQQFSSSEAASNLPELVIDVG